MRCLASSCSTAVISAAITFGPDLHNFVGPGDALSRFHITLPHQLQDTTSVVYKVPLNPTVAFDSFSCSGVLTKTRSYGITWMDLPASRFYQSGDVQRCVMET